ALLVDIAKDDIKVSADECNRSLFGKVIGDRPPNWIGIKRSMSQIWRLAQPMEVKELEPNYFQFIFQSKEDQKRVSYGTNWSFENQYLILREWCSGLNSKHPTFQELKLWVQVKNVPLNWLCTEVGIKICTVFKEVDNVVIANYGNHGGKFLRLLVTLDLNEPVPRCTKVRLGDEVASINFVYERLRNLCHYCGHIGHLEKGCIKKVEDIKSRSLKEGQYGDWLKAPEWNFWATGNHNSGSRSPPHSPRSSQQPSSPGHTSHQHTLDSQSSLKNQLIIHTPDSNPNLKSSANDSSSSSHTEFQKVTGVSSVPAFKEDLSKAMDIETRVLPLSIISPPKHAGKGKGKQSTWKRLGTKEGKLQRQAEPYSQPDTSSSGKRMREETSKEFETEVALDSK
ncbi:Unknown protein, partial [Striga hermonthica]